MTINVSNFSPAPGSTISLGGSLRFDVTFSPSSSAGPHAVIAAYGNSSFELVWDGEGFVAPYAASSRVALAGGGWRYTVRRTGRFPAAPIITVREFGRTRPGSLEPVRFVVTSNAAFNGEADGYAISGLSDGVTPANGDRCALMFQDDKTENGIYVVSGGVARSRAEDFGDVLGVSFSVREGDNYGGSTWKLSNPTSGGIDFGTTEIEFSQVGTGVVQANYYETGLVLRGRQSMVYDGPALAILTQAASGHEEGAEFYMEFDPGSPTEVHVPTDWNMSGDCTIDDDTFEITDWDAAVPHLLFLLRLGGKTWGVLRAGKVVDSSAPTVVSARVDGLNPNAVEVTFSEPVEVVALTGLSLIGTSITLTSIESGEGTDTVTFTTSGNFTGGESVSFVVGNSRVVADYSGNKVATSITAVAMVFGLKGQAAWSIVFEAGVAMLPASGLPANFTSWTDQVGGSLQLTQAGAGHASRTADPAVKFTNDATQRLHCNTSPITGSDFAVFCRYKFTSVGTQSWIPFSLDTDGSSSKWVRVTLTDNGSTVTAELSVYDGSTEQGTAAVISYPSDTSFHRLYVWRTGSTIYLQVDASIDSDSSNIALTSLSNISIGNLVYAGPTSYKPGNGSVSDFGVKASAGFVGTERADVDAYIAVRP